MSSREFNEATGEAKRAVQAGTVHIADRGCPSHVLMSYEHYRELTSDRLHFADILCRTSGIGKLDVEFPRPGDPARPAAFE
ncbi:MAG: type II toxin-antitoxin system Phd/YefM family antitoxin [Acidimicrobiia bacterium]|nr:type II toxin-antitoxin system Phd/YefM family antitoxin [Acidimicrobiia bacterium]